MNILVTGGAGYIGSHTCIELLQAGYNVVVIDNLENSSAQSLKRVEKITGKKITFYELDIRDKKALNKVFEENCFDGVIHFAGLKAVGDSVNNPLAYWETNIGGTINLLGSTNNGASDCFQICDSCVMPKLKIEKKGVSLGLFFQCAFLPLSSQALGNVLKL